MLNALRLVTVREAIDKKELALAEEILKRTSATGRTLFWNLFVENTANYDRIWFSNRIKQIESGMRPLVNDTFGYGVYSTLGGRRCHYGACPGSYVQYGWHKLTTNIAVSRTAGLPAGTLIDVVQRAVIEHNAWDVSFKAGVDKNDCLKSTTVHKVIMFPCELQLA